MNSKQFLESTTSGSVATVATPVSKTQTRGKGVYPNEKGGNLLTGKKTNKKFANSTSVKESQQQSVSESSESSDRLISMLNSFDYYTEDGDNYLNDNTRDKIVRFGSQWRHLKTGKVGRGAEELGQFLSKQGVAEAKVIGYVGDIAGHGKIVQCDKCGTDLRDDHGFALDNSTYICRDGQKCSMRQSRNRLAAMAAQGQKPRWRRDEAVAEGSKTVKDRKTGKEYDPAAEFEKLLKDPETVDQMKRMGKEQGKGWPQRKDPKGVAEAKLDEEDIIIVPGQGKKYKQGFIPKAKDRTDHEVEMALSDLFQSAKNAKQVYELIKDIPETVGIEGWVQEKIIKANDYLNTIREYLEHKQMSEMTVGVIAGGGVGEGVAEGYRVLPNIDREKYQERQGLEGPFRARNGKVYYYDPKAGLAYDPDTDFYIDYDTLTMMDREMSEGVIGKVLAGTALLASLWGIGQQQAQQVYSNSPQLQTLIKYHQMATQQNDQAKIQEIERRIENHKTRLSLGKGEVMGADDKPIVPKYESSIMRGLQNEQTNDWGSMSKRDFKRREMEHELGHETRKTYNKPKGMFFYNVPAGKETDASRAGLKQSKSGKWYGYQDNMLGKGRYWEPKNESVTENTDQEHDSASLQKHFGAEVAYDAASHGPKMMQRKDLKGNSYQLIRLPNKNYKATLVTENTDKCPECGGKLVAESELNEEGNKDACYHKVKSRYKVWPSAYASGALVKCRKVGASNWGNKSK